MSYTNSPRYSRKKVVRRTVNQVELKRRRETALALRTAGASYSEIVRANIGYNSTAHVSMDMKKILANFQYETPEDVLVLDLARIDEIQKILTAALRTGDLGQAGPIMRCMQFRRETLGITPEVITERRQNAQTIQNNGILVVQGTTGDYISAMAAAAGANPQEVKRELESVSESNKPEIIDAEVIPDTPASQAGKRRIRIKKAKSQTANLSHDHEQGGPGTSETDGMPSESPTKAFLDRVGKLADRMERRDSRMEVIPPVDSGSPLLAEDIPSGMVPEGPGVVLTIPIKPYDHNVKVTSGVSYKKPPRKMTEEENRKVVIRKLRKESEKDSVERNTQVKKI